MNLFVFFVSETTSLIILTACIQKFWISVKIRRQWQNRESKIRLNNNIHVCSHSHCKTYPTLLCHKSHYNSISEILFTNFISDFNTCWSFCHFFTRECGMMMRSVASVCVDFRFPNRSQTV